MLRNLLLLFLSLSYLGNFAFSQNTVEQKPGTNLGVEQSKSDSIIAHFQYVKDDTAQVDSFLKQTVKYLFSEPRVAMKLGKVAESRSIEIQDRSRLSKSYLLIGLLYRSQSALDLALKYLYESLEIAVEINDLNVQASVYNNIATIQGEEGDHESAISYFRKARQLLIQTGQLPTATIPLLNIAASYHENGDDERSLLTYDSVLLELKDKSNTLAMSTAKNNIGTIYSEMGNYPKAMEYYNDARRLKYEVKDMFGLSDLLIFMGKHFQRTMQLDSAESVLNTALEISKEIGARNKEYAAYKEMAQVEELRGNHQLALSYFKRYDSLHNEMNSEEIKATKVKLMTAFDIQAKDAEINLLSKDSQLQELDLERANYQKYFFGLGFVGMALLVVILMRSNRQRAKANHRLKILNEHNVIQREEIIAKNKDLNSQNLRLEELNREMDGILHIVAHDLKAPLNQAAGLANLVEISGGLNEDQIKYLSMISKVTDNAGRLVQDLIEISRLESEKEQIVLKNLNLIEACQAAKLAFEGESMRKNIQILMPENLVELVVNSEENSLRRVLENLLSNALKFSPRGASVWIDLELRGNKCLLSIRDEGPGISEEDQKLLFQKFAKLSARPTAGENSTGLGLALFLIKA